MDVFALRNTLIQQYRDYVQSSIRIRDTQIDTYVAAELKRGLLWPLPLAQLNPFFERGQGIQGLIAESMQSPACADNIQIAGFVYL